MSATRAPQHLEPAVGVAVRIANSGDACYDLVGWITHIHRRTARVDFARPDRIARWFMFEELADARIAATEPLLRVCSGFAAAGVPVELTTENLDWLEYLTWRRAQER